MTNTKEFLRGTYQRREGVQIPAKALTLPLLASSLVALGGGYQDGNTL